jgi:hypothetical protein
MGFAERVARVDRSARKILGGEPVVYRIGGGGGAFSPAFSAAFAGAPSAHEVTVTGIFDAAYVLQADQTAGVCATAPAVFLQLADLPTDPELDDPILTIRGVDYRVDHPETAGMGSVVLILRKVI